MRKSTPILEALQKELGLSKKKHTTDDMLLQNCVRLGAQTCTDHDGE